MVSVQSVVKIFWAGLRAGHGVIRPGKTICAMRIGMLADVHEDVSRLRWAIDVLSEQRFDCLLFLGDLFELGHRFRETVDLLAEAGAIGVWGNHDFGLCHDNARLEDHQRYGEPVLAFMSRLRPRWKSMAAFSPTSSHG